VKKLTVEDLYATKKDTLELELLTPALDLKRTIASATLSSPGLILAGFTERATAGRVHVLGETEIRYVESLAAEERRNSLDTFFALEMPVVLITKRLEVPGDLLESAEQRKVPVLRSSLKTGDVYRRLQPFLEERLAPATTLHGSLADVYGVGLLFTGRSGIGKSECVLDLVERGHAATMCCWDGARRSRAITWKSAALASSTSRRCSAFAQSGNKSASRS
jgi:HPr kinase/phosphorylase